MFFQKKTLRKFQNGIILSPFTLLDIIWGRKGMGNLIEKSVRVKHPKFQVAGHKLQAPGIWSNADK